MVVKNYPGSEDYDPTMPWMYGTVEVAVDYKCFVDNVCPTGPSYVKCWAACSMSGSGVAVFGHPGCVSQALTAESSTRSLGWYSHQDLEGRHWSLCPSEEVGKDLTDLDKPPGASRIMCGIGPQAIGT